MFYFTFSSCFPFFLSFFPPPPSVFFSSQSPERSIDSLGSPTGGSGADGLSEDEMLMLGLNDSIADDELELRAPYIPMSDQDEALDLLISNDMVMWSPPQTTDQKNGLKWYEMESARNKKLKGGG